MSWGADFVEALVRTLPYIRGDGPPVAAPYNDTAYPENPAFAAQERLKDPLALSLQM